MYAQRYNGGSAASDREIAAYYEPFGVWRGLVVWMDVMREEILTSQLITPTNSRAHKSLSIRLEFPYPTFQRK